MGWGGTVDRGLVSLAAHSGPRGNATSWVTNLPLKKDLYGVQQQTFLRAPWSKLPQLCIKVMDHSSLGVSQAPLGKGLWSPTEKPGNSAEKLTNMSKSNC